MGATIDSDIVKYILTQMMEVGYLYGKGEDGEIYKIKAKMPKPGETLFMGNFHMPKEGEEKQ